MKKRWALVVLLAAGCRSEEDDEAYALPPLETTLAGYSVHVPPLAVEDRELVKLWLDQRIAEWVSSHPEHPRDYLESVARQYPYIVVDDYRMEEPSSPTGYANGRIFTSGVLRVEACIYTRGTTPSYPWFAPQHTVRWNGESWSYGYLPGGVGLAVIAHELDHAIGIDHQ